MKLAIALLLASATLAGCAQGFRPQDRETPINWVEFDNNGQLIRSKAGRPGAIGCQDYDQRYVLWDHSVERPAGMSVADADAVCRSKEQTKFETGPGTYLSGAIHGDDGYAAANANQSVGSDNVNARQTGTTYRP
jgi:hypothetical protein